MKNQKQKQAGERLLFLKGMYDCLAGRPAKRSNRFYLRGYSTQYESEQITISRCWF